MLATLLEMAEKKEGIIKTSFSFMLTAKYLEACNMIFENGILSHEKITGPDSKPLETGLKWFLDWKEELQTEPGRVNLYPVTLT